MCIISAVLLDRVNDYVGIIKFSEELGGAGRMPNP